MSSASKSMGRRAATWMERCLWAIGFVALLVWLAVWGNSQFQQAKGRHELDRLAVVRDPSRAAAHATLARGDLIGRIEIPRLQISTVIFEGTDGGVLRDGAGHLTGSALPDQKGNVVLAAHRDSFFRPLRNIQNRDAIQVITPGGTKNYRVDSIDIVSPNRTDVMAPTRDSELTLITCYPFDWFGHAPQRFVVRAREVHDSAPVAAKPVPVKAAPRPSKPRVIAQAVADDSSSDVSAPVELVADTPGREIADEQAVETVAGPQPIQGNGGGNRVIRGLKKLNPKGLFAKFAGS